MESWKILDYTLEFEEETHTYLVDGEIVPSVTQVLHATQFKDLYKGVDKEVLSRAGQRGTDVHKAIELYCKGEGEDSDLDEVRGFKFLQKHYDIVPLANEIPVIVFDKGAPFMAGRLDMLADVEGKTTLADIKTTSVLYKDYLFYQLNLYRVGLYQSYGQDIERLCGLHLRNKDRKLVEIAIDDFCVKQIIEDYKKEVDG